MFTSILLPILLDHGVEIASPFVAASALWIAARVQKATGINIEKQLNELFNAVLARAAEAAIRDGVANPVAAVVASIRATNPDLVKNLKLDKPGSAFVKVAARAVKAAKDKRLK